MTFRKEDELVYLGRMVECIVEFVLELSLLIIDAAMLHIARRKVLKSASDVYGDKEKGNLDRRMGADERRGQVRLPKHPLFQSLFLLCVPTRCNIRSAE